MVENINLEKKTGKAQVLEEASQSVQAVGKKSTKGVKRRFKATIERDPVLDPIIDEVARKNYDRLAKSYHYAEIASIRMPDTEVRSRSYSIRTGEDSIDCVFSLYSQEEFYAKRVKASREEVEADIEVERRDERIKKRWQRAEDRFRSEINRLKSRAGKR